MKFTKKTFHSSGRLPIPATQTKSLFTTHFQHFWLKMKSKIQKKQKTKKKQKKNKQTKTKNKTKKTKNKKQNKTKQNKTTNKNKGRKTEFSSKPVWSYFL